MIPNLKSSSTALIVVDVQNDFLSGGALAVTDGDEVIDPVNKMIAAASTVVLTADWHPADHKSFACNHSDARPFETIEMPYGSQVLWPAHCIAGTFGAAFAAALKTEKAALVLHKGMNPDCDSYSAFVEADRRTKTGLAGWLVERGIRDVVVCGLAADFCVSWTALDAAQAGFAVTVVEDAVKAIGRETLEAAHEAWEKAGIQRANFLQFLI